MIGIRQIFLAMVVPVNENDWVAKKERLFNIILVNFGILLLISISGMFVIFAYRPSSFGALAIMNILVSIFVVSLSYYLSKSGRMGVGVYFFVFSILLLATFSGINRGINTPIILIYCLGIIIMGLLASPREVFITGFFSIVLYFTCVYMNLTYGIVSPLEGGSSHIFSSLAFSASVIIICLTLYLIARFIETSTEKLKKSEEKHRRYIDNSPVGIAVLDSNLNFLRVNASFEKITHRKRGNFIGRSIMEFHFVVPDGTLDHIKKEVWETGKSKGEIEPANNHGKLIAYEVIRLDDDQLLCYLMDISDRKICETNLEMSLVAEEALRRELRHRNKNLLQLAISMASLIQKKHSGKEAREGVGKVVLTLKTIAMLNQKLELKNGEMSVDLYEYSQAIVDSFAGADFCPHTKIQYVVDGESFKVHEKMAGSVALIITELIMNSLKHAFPGREKGKIGVSLEKSHSKAMVSVQDDGVGFKKKDGESGAHGVDIIAVLVDQIGGTLNYVHRDRGTKAVLTMPL